LWSNIFLTPFDRALTAAGFRLTRGADDFVVLWTTREEAQRALAFAERLRREELGVTLHPDKTRIVHGRQGFEFLGYKVKQGKGLRLPAPKRSSRANPRDLYAVPRPKSGQRFKDQIRSLTRRKAPLSCRR
jgi:RNA-directed DNA polymerase